MSEVNHMHGNESAENYLETILILSQRLPVVRSVDVATELNFKKSSVSVAMKKLRESDNIIVSPEGYITLTESGKKNCRLHLRTAHSSFILAGASRRESKDSRGRRMPHRTCNQRGEF